MRSRKNSSPLEPHAGLAGFSCALVCLLFLATPAAARLKDAPVVEVFMSGVADARLDLAFHRAQGVVADIYSEVGVSVKSRLPNPQITGCSKEPPRRTIVVALGWHTPGNVHPEAFAFSNPHSVAGACVTLFMDRLKPMMARQSFTTSSLLGHVLAHMSHSETGVLKEHDATLMLNECAT